MSRLTNPDWIAPHRARAYYFERNFPKNEEQCAFYNKLKEYENIGTVENLKSIIQANQGCEKILETSLMVSQNNRLLSNELEVYKRALENTIKEISRLNNNNVCANKQCAEPDCDYYTEVHCSALLDALTTSGIPEEKADEYAAIYLDVARNKQKNI